MSDNKKLISEINQIITTAQETDPVLTKALLGNATSVTKTQLGTVIVGVVTYISTKYGFGWDDDTVTFISAAIAVVGGFISHWIQLWWYRKSLQLVTQKIIPDTQTAQTVQSTTQPPVT